MEKLSDKTPYFVELLVANLQMRKLRNANYSLRAFARDLEISPAQLSLVLNSQQRLSAQNACKIALHLELSKAEFYRFVSSTLPDKFRIDETC